MVYKLIWELVGFIATVNNILSTNKSKDQDGNPVYSKKEQQEGNIQIAKRDPNMKKKYGNLEINTTNNSTKK